jgi:8-oxo-dGTP pyrophosphatase MutT (NUDIX family)
VIKKQITKKLPYRDNVCCLLYQDDLFLLVQLLGWPNNWWKLIQGGIESGESIIEAARRELQEEVGVKDIKIIAESKHKHQYEWSEDSIKLARNKWRGQIQRFLLIEYLGNKESVQANAKEVQQLKWMTTKELLNNIDNNNPNFKGYRDVIKKVLIEFKKYKSLQKF